MNPRATLGTSGQFQIPLCLILRARGSAYHLPRACATNHPNSRGLRRLFRIQRSPANLPFSSLFDATTFLSPTEKLLLSCSACRMFYQRGSSRAQRDTLEKTRGGAMFMSTDSQKSSTWSSCFLTARVVLAIFALYTLQSLCLIDMWSWCKSPALILQFSFWSLFRADCCNFKNVHLWTYSISAHQLSQL